MAETAMIHKEEKNTESARQRTNRSASRKNSTGIPTQLKERIEQSSGVSLDDVRVNYNSHLPARLDALAYTQGNRVEIAPGQDRHLPHELGHVVQQKLGTVRANARHPSGVSMNTDAGLEHQADEIGAGKRVAIVQRMVDNVVQRCPKEPPIRNYLGQVVTRYPGHIMSPLDPPFTEPPIVVQGPFTTDQKNGMAQGNSGGTNLAPHHRHQIPVRDGGIIDELPGPGHPAGNQHTTGNRHPAPSIFNREPGGNNLRAREISAHWKAKADRLVETKPGSGQWIDPDQ